MYILKKMNKQKLINVDRVVVYFENSYLSHYQ